MYNFLKKYKLSIVLFFFISAYAVYFSYFTILRYRTLYASYFDLGIMHQTVFNTYKAVGRLDFSRVLEMTRPYGSDQIKRMAIHNDMLLAFMAPFYFIWDGPETLLVIQSVVVAAGAWAVYKIVAIVFKKNKYVSLAALIFALCYLLNPYIQRATTYEFHAVTLSTTLLLYMYYFYLVRKYAVSYIFFSLALISKEQVSLTLAFFSSYIIGSHILRNKKNIWHYLKTNRDFQYGVLVFILSSIWFVLSIFVIIPYFRGGTHFAIAYYGDFGDSPSKVIFGILKNPFTVARYITQTSTYEYMFYLLGPLGFVSLISPIYLLIVSPEMAINILSNNYHMRELIFQYTAVLSPWIMIAGIYGTKNIINFLESKFKSRYISPIVLSYVLTATLTFMYLKSPLPYSREQDLYPIKYPQSEFREINQWSKTLHDRSLKVSTTGHIAPFFTSRRYFYNFSDTYHLADYVLIQSNEIYNDVEKDKLIPPYLQLQKDKRFEKIYQKNDLEIYRKIKK